MVLRTTQRKLSEAMREHPITDFRAGWNEMLVCGRKRTATAGKQGVVPPLHVCGSEITQRNFLKRRTGTFLVAGDQVHIIASRRIHQRVLGVQDFDSKFQLGLRVGLSDDAVSHNKAKQI